MAPEVVDLYNRRVPDTEYIRIGIDAFNKSLLRDIIIIYDGITHHIGIISGQEKTINLSLIINTIIENVLEWRKDEKDKAEVFRYHP